MRRSATLWLAFASCALGATALAQPASEPSAEQPPKGPADIIRGAGRERGARQLEQAATRAESAGQAQPPAQAPAAAAQAQPPAQAPAAAAQAQPPAQAPAAAAQAQPPAQAPAAAEPQAGGASDPHAAGEANPHAGIGERGEPPRISTEQADASLPDGTIRVLVRDPNGSPAAGAEVALGIMKADGSRESRAARTDASGVATFAGLTGGERQAYRVNVPYQGAKYSSNPFKLPPHGGYAVEIRRLATTRDTRLIVLYVGATSIELKDDRIHVVQQARLINLGGQTYVFPEQGTLVKLPQGFMAVQSQDSMGDQRITEAKGEGVRVSGSLPPGEATLLWGFDLPLEGREARFEVGIPWLTFAYRVIADAPEGMSLSVEGMPQPTVHADGGRRFLVTETQRRVGDPPFDRLQVSLRGIPGPGPGRVIASLLAALFVIGGVWLSRSASPRAEVDAQADLAERKAELLERARALQAMHEAGETGPQYHAEQMAAITDELAALLFEESQRKEAAKAAAART